MEPERYLLEIVSAWLFGLMVFFVNPLNDMANPASRINYHYCENARIRKAVEESYSGEIHIEWQEMTPYIHSGIVGLMGWIMMRFAAFIVVR
jgi:hypothetical protein